MKVSTQLPRGSPAAPQLHEQEAFSHCVVNSSRVSVSAQPAAIKQLL
jgi:hypothetical protein